MKHKILAILMCVATLFLTSCGALAQVSVTTAIDSELGTIAVYSHMYNDFPVIYHAGVPYVRYYYNNIWAYRAVPFEYRHLIVHLDRPREFRGYIVPPHHRRHYNYGPSSTRYLGRGHMHRPHGLKPRPHDMPHRPNHAVRHLHEKR